MGFFRRKKKEDKKEQPKNKEVKLCNRLNHDWYRVGACKDFVGGNPCTYYPDGCSTCNDRYGCLVQSDETYNDRYTAIFYACKKCPAVNMDGYAYEWKKRKVDNVLDIRTQSWRGMDSKLIKELRDKWK